MALLKNGQKHPWLFWLPCMGLTAYCVLAFAPGIHYPHLVDKLLLLASLAGFALLGFRPTTIPQVIFLLVSSLAALSFLLVAAWHTALAILVATALLFMIFISAIVLRALAA
jgi:hypothetical protein